MTLAALLPWPIGAPRERSAAAPRLTPRRARLLEGTRADGVVDVDPTDRREYARALSSPDGVLF